MRLLSVTKSVTIENFWKLREIAFALQTLTRIETTTLLHPVGPAERWMLTFVEKPLQ